MSKITVVSGSKYYFDPIYVLQLLEAIQIIPIKWDNLLQVVGFSWKQDFSPKGNQLVIKL